MVPPPRRSTTRSPGSVISVIGWWVSGMMHEQPMSRTSIAATRTAGAGNPGPVYERGVKRAFYGRLRHRQRLMTMLERKPARFDLLFDQLERTPRFAELLQRDRNAFSPMEWMYLYGQGVARVGIANGVFSSEILGFSS